MIKLNECYCMDNLELLKQIDDNSIDLIYCDILYNTGKKFRDYDDNLGTPQQAIEWYKPRLIEMKRVLKDTGSIYLQCDYRLVHYLKIEMDNLFGLHNFQNNIVWCYNGGGTTNSKFNKKHDDILFYTKSKQYIFNTQYQPYKETTAKRFKNIHKGETKEEELLRGTPMTDWWTDISLIANPVNKEYTGYNTQKPKALIKRIIEASSNKGDIIADFFCGSGTTGVVAKELKRQYILCDINSKSIEISKNRIADTYQN